jgi:molybdenum-dependent DNA-binding transcriptional regulator ModE
MNYKHIIHHVRGILRIQHDHVVEMDTGGSLNTLV